MTIARIVRIVSVLLRLGKKCGEYTGGPAACPVALAAMGYGLPGAIALKLVRPERPVACFTGDGSRSAERGCFVVQALAKPVPVSTRTVLNGSALEVGSR